ncbi:hypothetical protein, partial [Burkholderia gladioli]
ASRRAGFAAGSVAWRREGDGRGLGRSVIVYLGACGGVERQLSRGCRAAVARGGRSGLARAGYCDRARGSLSSGESLQFFGSRERPWLPGASVGQARGEARAARPERQAVWRAGPLARSG